MQMSSAETHPSLRRDTGGVIGLGVALLGMAAASLPCMWLVTQSARSTGGDGEGEGDVGEIKIYLLKLFEGFFLCLFLVFLVGAIAAFITAWVLRRRPA